MKITLRELLEAEENGTLDENMLMMKKTKADIKKGFNANRSGSSSSSSGNSEPKETTQADYVRAQRDVFKLKKEIKALEIKKNNCGSGHAGDRCVDAYDEKIRQAQYELNDAEEIVSSFKGK